MCDELARLRRWKAEALEVLGQWQTAWHAAGQPGGLGESISLATAREIERLRFENRAWRDGVADVVEPLGFDREAACGPADLLPGLLTLAERSEPSTPNGESILDLLTSLGWCVEITRLIDHPTPYLVTLRRNGHPPVTDVPMATSLAQALDLAEAAAAAWSGSHAPDLPEPEPETAGSITYRSTGRGAYDVMQSRAEGPDQVLAMVQFTEGVRGRVHALERFIASLRETSQDGTR